MERVKIAGVLYRLVRERARKSPRVVAVALIAADTWGIRADFDDGRRDYRYPMGGPLEEIAAGFDAWPPPLSATEREDETVPEMRLRVAAKK
jgi:hypothetical protein